MTDFEEKHCPYKVVHLRAQREPHLRVNLRHCRGGHEIPARELGTKRFESDSIVQAP